MDPMPPQPVSARRVDWRFLLPSPAGAMFDHLLLLGASPADHAAARAVGVARRISTTPDPADPADAVVVLAGAPVAIEDATAALAPDGALYWEVDRRRASDVALTPARSMRRLQAQGVAASAAYWVKPHFPNRQMYLPIDAPGALRWYLDTLYKATTTRRRLVEVALRAVAATGGLPACAPCYAVTAVRGVPRPPAVIAGAAEAAGWPVHDLAPVFLAHGEAEWNRVAVLLFHREDPVPTAAIKFARRTVFNQQVWWEHRCLRELAERLGPRLRRSVPSSSMFHWNDLAVAVETCAPGATLSRRLGAELDQLRDDLHQTTRWLAEFHGDTIVERVPAHEWLRERLLEGLWPQYAATFGITDAEQRLWTAIEGSLSGLGPATVPIVWQHRDFGPWNVYRDGAEISVIDWEVARHGPALADLLYFATHWASTAAKCADDDERLAHFEALFCDGSAETPLASAIRRELDAYMRRLTLAPALLPYLLAYTMLEQALDRATRFTTLEHSLAADRPSNRYVGYVGVLARHADTLFATEVRHAA